MLTLTASDTAEPGLFETIFRALDRESHDAIGPAQPRLLAIPLHQDGGVAIGGLWAVTLFRWLLLEMIFVPEPMRRQGVGRALVTLAETEARNRGCLGMTVDTFSPQAALFYQKMGFTPFGTVADCPPGHQRLFLQKRMV